MDIRLINLLPPTPAIGQPPAVQSATTSLANILAQFPNGSVLSGFILNRDASGNPILRTEKGDITFASNFFLKIGSEVVIRIANSGGHQNAHIVTVNGLPPEIAAQQSGFSQNTDVVINEHSPHTKPTTLSTINTQPTTTISATITTGSNVSALVITPELAAPTLASPAPATPKILAPGTSLLLAVLGIDTPPPTISSGNAITGLTPSLAPTITQTVAGLLPELPPTINNQQLQTNSYQPSTIDHPPSISLSTITANQQAASTNFGAPLGQVITATLVQHHGDGSATFTSPLGTLRVPYAQTLTEHAQLSARVTSLALPTSATITIAGSTAPLPPASIAELAKSWESLKLILQQLQIEGSPLSISGLPTIPTTPNDTPKMANQLLFFVTALKGGDFRGWLGNDTIRKLEEKGFTPLLRKAEGEFMLMARQFADVQPGNWQTLLFPVAVHGQVEQVRAFIKREKKKNEHGKPTDDEDTRFVLEMSLSALGEVQMDGLVKRREEKLQFDLMVRSLTPLPKPVERDIAEIYTATAELTGYRGQILFQAVHHFPVHPLEDVLPHADDVVV